MCAPFFRFAALFVCDSTRILPARLHIPTQILYFVTPEVKPLLELLSFLAFKLPSYVSPILYSFLEAGAVRSD